MEQDLLSSWSQVGVVDVDTTTTHKPTIPNKSASKGCATQGEAFNGIHNHKLQAMKKPPKDAQLQGWRSITSKDNLNSKFKA
jgi:hypothetical protein